MAKPKRFKLRVTDLNKKSRPLDVWVTADTKEDAINALKQHYRYRQLARLVEGER